MWGPGATKVSGRHGEQPSPSFGDSRSGAAPARGTAEDHQDLVRSSHLPGGQPGSVAKGAHGRAGSCPRLKGDTVMSAHVAVVAGAGGGLGQATALTLAAGGLTVVAVDRN